MTKAFISYHHDNDQSYKVHLSEMATYFGCFEDGSVNTGDISDDGRSSQAIRRQIRDVYLRDSQVTILLCGQETKHRKHVDWELKSSMIDGSVNHRSGILVINLPGVSSCWEANLPAEKYQLYSDYYGGWASFETRTDFEARYPRMPDRIIDQLVRVGVTISVVPWERIEYDPNALRWLIDETAKQRFNWAWLMLARQTMWKAGWQSYFILIRVREISDSSQRQQVGPSEVLLRFSWSA